jgi:hypothetical protein
VRARARKEGRVRGRLHLPELGVVQRLKHIADQISLSSSFQILAADPCSGRIFSTPQCQARRLFFAMRTRHNIAVSNMLNFPFPPRKKNGSVSSV